MLRIILILIICSVLTVSAFSCASANEYAIIGGADGPTAILVTDNNTGTVVAAVVAIVIIIVSVVLLLKRRRKK